MRRALLVLATAFVALAGAASASASKPAREIVPAPGDAVITDQCAFAVLGHIEGGEIDTAFFDRGGDLVKKIGVFPGQTLTLTNLDTGDSITVTNSGSSQARLERDGSVTISITGHGPLPSELFGMPGLWYLNGGHVVVTLDQDGNPTAVSVEGNVANLCEALAP